MNTFIDTSAVLAVLDNDDENHIAASRFWAELLMGDEQVVTSSYILLETHALVQRRLGMSVLHRFQQDIVPALSVTWVDEPLHQAGSQAVFVAGKRNLSLVDCVSFALMRQLGIKTAFTFDRHFRDQGFDSKP